jgi:hypothetical protein
MTSEYSAIYTDDSNDDDMIALAANNMITNNNKAFYKFPLFSK